VNWADGCHLMSGRCRKERLAAGADFRGRVLAW